MTGRGCSSWGTRNWDSSLSLVRSRLFQIHRSLGKEVQRLSELHSDTPIFFFRVPPVTPGVRRLWEEETPGALPTVSPIHFLHPSRDPVLGPRALPGQASGLLAQDLVS